MSEWLKLWNHMHSFSGSVESTQEQPWRKLIFHNPWVVDLQADSWWERSTLVAWVAPFCSLVPLSTEIHLSHHQFLVVLTPPTVPLASPLKKKKSKKTWFNNFLSPFPTLDHAPCTLDGANLHPSRLSLFAKFSGRFDDTVEGRWTSGVAMEVTIFTRSCSADPPGIAYVITGKELFL